MTRAVPAVGETLAISTYVSVWSVPPTSPSAKAQRVPVITLPAELWPSYQLAKSPGHHMARSTMIGTPLVDSTVVETATSASGNVAPPSKLSKSTQMLDRLLAGACIVLVNVRPSPSR